MRKLSGSVSLILLDSARENKEKNNIKIIEKDSFFISDENNKKMKKRQVFLLLFIFLYNLERQLSIHIH